MTAIILIITGLWMKKSESFLGEERGKIGRKDREKFPLNSSSLT